MTDSDMVLIHRPVPQARRHRLCRRFGVVLACCAMGTGRLRCAPIVIPALLNCVASAGHPLKPQVLDDERLCRAIG